MKTTLALVFLATVAIAAAVPSHGHNNRFLADKQLLQRQNDILKLLVRIEQPNYYEDQAQLGNTYDIESSIKDYKYPEEVKKFVFAYKKGFLPRGVPYSSYYTSQSYETELLFKLLVAAKDYDTFYKTAAWARININELQFLIAFSSAVYAREDLQDIVLPAPYEIYPYLFVDADVIQKAYETKMWDVGLTSHKTYVFPANYTVYTPEQSVKYFTEDPGLSTFYINFYYNYAPFFNGTEYGVQYDRRGDLIYYLHQQLLAHYSLERLSNDLPDVEPYYYDKPFQTTYYPNLRYPNGQEVPVRPYQYTQSSLYGHSGHSLYESNFEGGNKEYYSGNYLTGNYQPTYYYGYANNYNYYYPEDIQLYEKRILDGIDIGFLVSEEAKVKYPLYEDYLKGINYLGNVIEGNGDSINKKFYGAILTSYRQLQPYSNIPVAPSALQNIFTVLRDPANYQILKRIDYLFRRYKNSLPQYTYQELAFPGVTIENVDVDKLITYFDYFDIDLDNVVNVKTAEDGQFIDYRARQTRLNHKPFTYKIDVNSDKTTDVYVRVFLGPKHDYLGREFNINDRRHYFVEIDRFPYKVQTGKTTIQRNSRESNVVASDYPSYRTLLRKVGDALEGKDQFYIDKTESYCGYPERLLLPKGKKGGQAFTFYVILTPYTQQGEHDFEPYNYKAFSYCGVGYNNKYPDDKPLGFPFDRPISGADFYTPNSYFKDVVIFHKKQEDVNAATTY